MTGRLWVPQAHPQLKRLLALGVSNHWDPRYTYTCEPYQDAAYTGANVLPDPGFADVSLWSGGSGATLTNETGRTGNCLRVARIAGSAGYGYPTALSLTTNARYFADVWAKSDGTATISVYAHGAAMIGASAPGGSWTHYQGSGVADGAQARFWKSAAGAWTQYDDGSITRVPILTRADALIGSTNLLQAGAAGLRPTYLPLAAAQALGLTCPAWQTDGTAQYWLTPFIPNSGPWTVGGWLYIDSVAAAFDALFGSTDGVKYAMVSKALAVLSTKIGTGASVTHPTPLTVGWHHIMIGLDATTGYLWLDGVLASTGVTGAPYAGAMMLGCRNVSGVASTFWPGKVASFSVAAAARLTTEQIQAHMAITRPQGV